MNNTEYSLNNISSNIYPSIIYLSGDKYLTSIRVDNIRELKSIILKKEYNLRMDRFIILDDIELFNINSLNALLKTIEEPTVSNNYFLLDK